MPHKVTWKKGMRLSADVFNAMDSSNEENARQAILVATGGRSGLFPATRPFELSVNITGNILEVISLSCHGVTKSGKIIDIDFDSDFTHTFDTRVVIPAANSGESFLLIVKMHDKEWREVSDMLSEALYTFELIGEHSPLDNNSLPVGCLVNQYGWRLDETDFIPPCLYIRAHPKFEELYNRTRMMMKSISDKCFYTKDCVARYILSLISQSVSFACISLDKEAVACTPERLLALIQQVVSSFVSGCNIDEYVALEDVEPFVEYVRRPYDVRNIYRDIEEGLGLCAEISVKMDAVCSLTQIKEVPKAVEEKPAPKTRPAPEPKAVVRNKWNGPEI